MEKRRNRVFTSTLFIAVLSLPACDNLPLEPEILADLDPEVVAFVVAMNAHRTDLGCPELAWNVDVAAVAQGHSQDMVDRGFFAHTNPDGKSPFDRMRDAGIGFSGAAENIAWGYPTAEAVLTGWLNSPGHKANIENCNLTGHGVGLVGTHWTHLFIRP
jgi:uncharacterized protein YkwD